MKEADHLDFTAFTLPDSQILTQSAAEHFNPLAWLAQKLSIWVILILIVGLPTLFTGLADIINPSQVVASTLTLLGMAGSLLFLAAAITWRRLYDAESSARIKRFASANRFEYLPIIADPELTGMPFDNGSYRHARDIVEGVFGGLRFEFGNFDSFVRQSTSKPSREIYGYVRIDLPRNLPHIVLDNKSDNYLGLTSLADDFSGKQKLQLEGDFNKYFDLYCPKAYERDALYIFTPDLMALLIDHGNEFDMEVKDNKLYLYRYGGFDLTESKHVELIFKALERIGQSMKKRSSKYADAQTGDISANVVATHGRRLKRGYQTLVLTVLLGLIVSMIYFILEFYG